MKSLTYCLRCLLMTLMLTLSVGLCANAQSGSVQRLALVIGNDAYANVRPLVNARNDARLMAITLKKAGFDVTTASDLDRATLWQTIDIFKSRIQKGDEIVFYFAGHGVQIKSQVIMMSAGRNQKTQDYVPGQKQPNGLFTWELAQVIQTPGVEIRVVLETVKNNVDDKAKSAGHQQRPSLVNDLRGNFYFFGPTTVQVNNGAAADPEEETWAAAKQSGSEEGSGV